jgi:hypothetical protein
MAQLFKRRANAIAKSILIALPLVILGGSALLFGFSRSDVWTRVGNPIEQPVPFSHQHHVGGLGIDCRYCHTGAESSAFAGVPPTETCMTCHSQVWKDAPVLAPVRDSFQDGEPLRWTRVHDLPDYTYFDHSIHVAKGIGCESCHGRVDRMPLTALSRPLYMRWCLDCHRQPQNFLRPPGAVTTMDYQSPPNDPAIAQRLLQDNHVSRAGLTDCSTCHR